MCLSVAFSDVCMYVYDRVRKDNRKSSYSPEQYGRKQLGLQSSFFMNRICPLSFRQKKFLSPRTKTEDADWLKGMIQMSRACSPMFRVQSTCKAKASSDVAANKYYVHHFHISENEETALQQTKMSNSLVLF